MTTHLRAGKRQTRELDAQLKGDSKSTKQKSSLKTKQKSNQMNSCIGVDTCSARSISCMKEDFLDLEIVENEDDHLRGIGGSNGYPGGY